MPTAAYPGTRLESARWTDASVLFNGIPTSYSEHVGEVANITFGAMAKITFPVVHSIRDPIHINWTVLMRGQALLKDLKDFQRRSGNVMTASLRIFDTGVAVNSFPDG